MSKVEHTELRICASVRFGSPWDYKAIAHLSNGSMVAVEERTEEPPMPAPSAEEKTAGVMDTCMRTWVKR